MGASVDIDREGTHARVTPGGRFDLAHARSVVRAIDDAEPRLRGCDSVEVDLGSLEGLDGAGAVLLADFMTRVTAGGGSARLLPEGRPEAARLVSLYLQRRRESPAVAAAPPDPLTRIGSIAAEFATSVRNELDFLGRFVVSIPRAAAAPRSVDWGSLPDLLQRIGADALPVTSAANLVVGIIVGLLGVSQLGQFGAVSFVPELVVVAHFRELGPLVTAIVVAGRSGAGLASELATMQVSEEVDALKTMGFDPMRWLVLLRCLALMIVLPLLTWIGDALAILGGMVATAVTTDMPPRIYLVATGEAITLTHFVAGLVKTPMLALAIGLIACSQGLAARGGAAAVGARTTSAVVLTIFAAIVISSLFTFSYSIAGI